jgi:predicted transcriptional regulator
MTEYEQARAWRNKLGLTWEQLSGMTGYSKESIYWFERGRSPPRKGHKNKPIDDRVFYRYKMTCAGVDATLRRKKEFAW